MSNPVGQRVEIKLPDGTKVEGLLTRINVEHGEVPGPDGPVPGWMTGTWTVVIEYGQD